MCMQRDFMPFRSQTIWFSAKDFLWKISSKPALELGGQCVQESKPKGERIKQHITSASSPAPSTHTLESVLNHFCCEEKKKKEKRKELLLVWEILVPFAVESRGGSGALRTDYKVWSNKCEWIYKPWLFFHTSETLWTEIRHTNYTIYFCKQFVTLEWLNCNIT